MERVEPNFISKGELKHFAIGDVGGHEGQYAKGTNNDQNSGNTFDHNPIDFIFTDGFAFPKFIENNTHIITNYIAPDPSNNRYVDALELNLLIELMNCVSRLNQ